MSEEEVVETLAEVDAPAELTEEIQPQEEIQTEGEPTQDAPEAPEPSPEPSPTGELWKTMVPDLAEHYNELSPEAREGILLKRLAAQAASAQPKAEQTEVKSATEPVKTPPPPIAVIPPLDVGALASRVQQAVDSGDSAGIASAISDSFKSMYEHTQAMSQRNQEIGVLALKALEEQDSVIRSLTQPTKFESEAASIPGATKLDIELAMQKFNKGEVTTIPAAIKLAMYERMASSRPQPTEAGKAKAQAIKANQQFAPTVNGRGIATRIPETDEEMAEFMRREQQSRKK